MVRVDATSDAPTVLLFSEDVKNGNGGNTALLAYPEFVTLPIPVIAGDDIASSSAAFAFVLVVPNIKPPSEVGIGKRRPSNKLDAVAVIAATAAPVPWVDE